MPNNEEYYDSYLSVKEVTFRSHIDITPDELTSALHSLVFLRNDMYLGLQVTNLTVVDQFIMNLEHQTLKEYIQTDKTPPSTMFLNAQSQMWILAAYELLRTWRARAKDIIKLAKNGGLELKAASLEEDQGYLHAGREMRAKQFAGHCCQSIDHRNDQNRSAPRSYSFFKVGTSQSVFRQT